METQLIKHKGWIKFNKAENELLNQQLGEKSASAKAVWLALLILANERRVNGKDPEHFTVRVTLIAHVAGVSYKTTQRMLKELEQLKLLKIAGGNTPEGCTYQLNRIEGTQDLKTQVNDKPSACPTSLKKEEEEKESSLLSSFSSDLSVSGAVKDQDGNRVLSQQDPNKW